MPRNDPVDIDLKSLPFDQLKTIQRLSSDRRGQGSIEHARHQLYVGRDKTELGERARQADLQARAYLSEQPLE